MLKNRSWVIVNLAIAAILASLVLSKSPLRAQDGSALYKTKCAACHGPEGAGKTAMGTALKIRDLRSEDVQKQTDADLNRIITKGKNKMPAFDGKLKHEQIEQLVGYVRALAKKS